MIDLALHGDPDTCHDTADDLDRLGGAMAEAQRDLVRAAERGGEFWSGVAGRAFGDTMTGMAGDSQDFCDEITRASTELRAFADEFYRARDFLAVARDWAHRHGMPVEGDVILPLADGLSSIAPGVPMTEALAEAAYAYCRTNVDLARGIEGAAHVRLQAAMKEITERSFFDTWLRRLGILPPDGLGIPGVAVWATGAGLLGLGTTSDWMLKHGSGRFAPRGPDGRYVSPRTLSKPRAAWEAMKKENWQARLGQRAVWHRWAKVARWGSFAGAGIAGGLGSMEQWQADADDPALGSSERVARAGVSGAATGIFALGGAAAGTAAGAAVGSLFPGPGTVIGGAVGGVVGGAIGAEVGEAAGGLIVEPIGDAVDQLAGVAAAGWDAASETASGFGDAVTFWD